MCACCSFNCTHGPSTVHFLWGQLLPNVRTTAFASDCIYLVDAGHKHTNVDQWDSGSAVQSTDMQTKNQEHRMIHVDQFFTKSVCKFGVIVHMQHQMWKQGTPKYVPPAV